MFADEAIQPPSGDQTGWYSSIAGVSVICFGVPPLARTVKISRLMFSGTHTENTTFVPAGFHEGSKIVSPDVVSCSPSEPSMSATQTSSPVPGPASLTNVTCEPSGESCPGKAAANPSPIGCSLRPFASIPNSRVDPPRSL